MLCNAQPSMRNIYASLCLLRLSHDKLRFCMTGKRVSSWTRVTNFLVMPDKHDKSRNLPDIDIFAIHRVLDQTIRRCKRCT